MKSTKEVENKIPIILNEYKPGIVANKFYPAKAGYNNSVFHINTSDGQELVLRILNSSDTQKINKENIVYSLLREHGVPVPKILKSDDTQILIPYSYVISERLKGESLTSQRENMRKEAQITVYKDLAKYLATIHSITFNKFGAVTLSADKIIAGPANEISGLNKGPFNDWKSMFNKIIRTRLEELRGTEFEDMCEIISEYFDKNYNLIQYKIVPRLLHLDLHGNNIFVENGNITGILDVEESLIGHNEYDLMRTELGNFSEESLDLKNIFYTEYCKHMPLDQGYEKRRNFYKISRSLVQAKCLVQLREAYSSNLHEDIRITKNAIYELMFA